jgi:hypothetical protein
MKNHGTSNLLLQISDFVALNFVASLSDSPSVTVVLAMEKYSAILALALWLQHRLFASSQIEP